MLRIEHISKRYVTGDLIQQALDDVSLNLRNNEFVAILGPSGSGKTTLLNIIGGLDRYDSGDLVIGDVSTRAYSDRDWDSYRNHSVGFVFQSYNLIPHQTILSNVELALTISGISRSERRRRAQQALEQVGLGEHLHKRPNQLSGGQMQRVAIARALVNDPDILLADEPTGALDSDTSVQVMELLKEVASDRLVVMVTHNPQLAERYATRIVKLQDGRIADDSDPLVITEADAEPAEHRNMGKASMSFLTSLSLSFNNLRTKKGRTILTAFAGSIGIIGIALILSLSHGVNDYITKVETDTMGAYPIELEKETYDLEKMMNSDEGGPQSGTAKTAEHDTNGIYSKNIVADSVSESASLIKKNDLGKFKTYLDANVGRIQENIRAVEYRYAVTPQVFRSGADGEAIQVSPATLEAKSGSSSRNSAMSGATSSAWAQLADDQILRESQYELLEGSWPAAADEAALIISKDNEVSDYTLYTLGLMDISRMNTLVDAARDGAAYDDPLASFSYSDAIGLTYQVFAPSDLYTKNEDGVWVNKSDDDDYLREILGSGNTVKISCVLRSNKDSDINSGVAYTGALVRQLMDTVAQSDIVSEQLADPGTNVLTGEAFEEKSSSDTLRQVGYAADKNLDTASPATYNPNAGQEAVMTAVWHPQASGLQTAADDGSESSSGSGSELPASYTVRFLNYDGSVLSTAKDYLAGEKADNLPKTDPTRPADAASTYIFIGWQSSTTDKYYTTAQLPAVTEAVDYTALYYAVPVGTAPGGVGDSGNSSGISIPGIGTGTDLSNLAGGMDASMFDMSSFDLSAIYGSMSMELSDDQLSALLAQMSDSTPSTYADVLAALGYTTLTQPSSIILYPSDFAGKEAVTSFISSYNDQVGADTDKVTYNDLVGTMISSVTTIVNVISYVLIAFVAVSLIVSSIMIGIITFISVLERTKEIGILRAIGASKKNISQVFNAETFIVGLLSGLIGIGVSLLLLIPGNVLIHNLAETTDVNASLPVVAAFFLITLSVLLTLIGGFIPAKKAASKDPVAALRTE